MSPEPSPNPPRRRRRRTAAVPRAPAVAAPPVRPVDWKPALALLPLLCVALGGGTARWSQGIVLLALGGVLLAFPPRASLGRGINLVLGGLAALALTAFLPARWFAWPEWRAALVEDFGVALPGTLSPQPWLSAERYVLFLAGIGWFYRMATVGWTAAERPRGGRVFAAGVVALAGLFLTLYKLGVVVPFWPTERHFGPFPNRNQTADFLAVGALPVLGCMFLSLAREPAAGGGGLAGGLAGGGDGGVQQFFPRGRGHPVRRDGGVRRGGDGPRGAPTPAPPCARSSPATRCRTGSRRLRAGGGSRWPRRWGWCWRADFSCSAATRWAVSGPTRRWGRRTRSSPTSFAASSSATPWT